MSLNKKRTSIKTTAHKRRIVLYLSSKELVEQWNKEADAAGLTTSRFIQGVVKNYFENGNILKSQKMLQKQVEEANAAAQHLRQENTDLQKKIDILDILTDRYEDENRRLRNQSFATKDLVSGSRSFDKKLIDILLQNTILHDYAILDLLKVDPNDAATIHALNNQLQHLLDLGAVTMVKGGYQWRRR